MLVVKTWLKQWNEAYLKSLYSIFEWWTQALFKIISMKKISVVILMLLAYSLSAQKLNIKGEVQDTLNNPLVRATVMLLDQDSVLLDYTQSGLDGYFDFKKIDLRV